MCVFITAVPITKPLAWGEGSSGGYVLTRDDEPRVKTQNVCPNLGQILGHGFRRIKS